MKIFPRLRLELQQKGNLVGAVTTKLGGRIIVMDGDQHMMVTGSVAAANIYECVALAVTSPMPISLSFKTVGS